MVVGYLDFDEFIVASEPHKWERAEAWNFASCQWTGIRTIFEGSPKGRMRDIEGTQKSRIVKNVIF